MMGKLKHSDLLAGLGLCAVAVFVAAGLAVLGAVIAAQAVLDARRKSSGTASGNASGNVSGNRTKKSPARAPGGIFRVAAFTLLCLAYAFALRPFGFILSSIAFLFAAVNFFGYAKHRVTAVLSVCLTLVVYGVFRHVFLVLLPAGSLL